MNILFLVLLLLSLVIFVPLLIKPGTNKKTDKPNKRKDVLIGGGFFVLLFALFTAITWPHDKPIVAVVQPASHVASPSPAQPAPKTVIPLSTINPQAAQILTTATNYESQLMDTIRGEASQSDAATYNSVFTTRWRDGKTSNDVAVTVQTAYNNASDLYVKGNQTAPDAVGNWNSDGESVDTDIVQWMDDQEHVNADHATGNDPSAHQAKVNTDYQTYRSDLSQAKADISQLQP